MAGARAEEQRKANMDRIYHQWNKALSQNDADELLKLHAEDAIIESPLIPALMRKE